MERSTTQPMAHLSHESELEAPPRGIRLPFVLTKKVVTDPGIIYTGADALLFATTNIIGFAACMSAVGAAAVLKSLDVAQPRFLTRHPKVAAIAFDDRTPLRSGALALLVVGGAALGGGALLPAAASFFLSAANFAMAESITRQDHNKPTADFSPRKKADKPSVMSLLFKRPDLYLNTGFALAGLMAGGAALFVLPLVATAFGVGLSNVIKGRPEHAGHPKMITSMAAIAFAAIGFAGGHGLIAAAHLVNAAVIAEFERRVTPGGSMFKVVKESLGTLAGLLLPGRAERKQAPEPVIEQMTDVASAPSRFSTQRLRRFFGGSAVRPQPLPQQPANTNEPEKKQQGQSL